MDPRNFLSTAELLTNPDYEDGEEADWRSAISRAYYAAFLVARALLNDMGFHIRRKFAHQDVQDHFTYSTFESRRGIKIHKRLLRLLDKRKDADYVMNDEIQFNRSDAEYWIGDARKIIEEFDACQDDPEFYEEIKSAIEIWRNGRSNPGQR